MARIYGADEAAAYDAQIARLKQLGASEKRIKEVETSRAFVAKGKR